MPAQPLFVAPVGADAFADRAVTSAGFRVEQQLARHAAHLRIGERRYERAQRVVRKRLPRVGEDQDLVPCGGNSGVERSGLAAGRQEHGVDAVAIAADDVRRFVGGSVRDDDNLAQLRRIVHGQQIVETGAERSCLVSHRQHDRDRRRDGVAVHGFWREPRPRRQDCRIPDVHVEDGGERDPERCLHQPLLRSRREKPAHRRSASGSKPSRIVLTQPQPPVRRLSASAGRRRLLDGWREREQ